MLQETYLKPEVAVAVAARVHRKEGRAHVPPAWATAKNGAVGSISVLALRPIGLSPHDSVAPDIFSHRIAAARIADLVRGDMLVICVYLLSQ